MGHSPSSKRCPSGDVQRHLDTIISKRHHNNIRDNGQAKANVHTPPSTYDNQPITGTKRASRKFQSIRHRNITKKNIKTVITITFKGNVTESGAVLRIKDKNYKKFFQNMQENMLQYVVVYYNKGVELAPVIRKPEDMYLSIKEPGPPTGS